MEEVVCCFFYGSYNVRYIVETGDDSSGGGDEEADRQTTDQVCGFC